jgi:hypothetical protein
LCAENTIGIVVVACRAASTKVELDAKTEKIVGGREPAEVGHSLQIPNDDAWLHAGRSVAQRLGIEKDVLRYSEPG